MKKFVFALFCCFIISPAAPAKTQAQKASETISYSDHQKIILEPGDVINFYGGMATTGEILPCCRVYGHSALYLGINPETKKPTFFDFTTTKGEGPLRFVFGGPAAFYGRILTELEFLKYNAGSHQSFDVFRLKGAHSWDKQSAFREAKKIATKDGGWYGFSFQICSSAVSAVLSAGTGKEIPVHWPDGFADDPMFQRYPAQTTINIAVATLDAQGRENPPPPPSAPRGLRITP